MITPNATQEGAGRMTLAQLKYVVTVAKAGTMTEAAKELFISQPSLTKSIKELECKTGVGTGRTSGRKIHE